MKKSNRNIERDIVDRLQQHEFEFDPKAWEQMEAMLDDEPRGFWAAFQSKHGSKIIAGVVVLLLFAMSVYYALPEAHNSNQELAKKQMLDESVATEIKNIENETVQANTVSEFNNSREIKSVETPKFSETKEANNESSKTEVAQVAQTVHVLEEVSLAKTDFTTATKPNEVKVFDQTISKPKQLVSQAQSNQTTSSKPSKHLIADAIAKTQVVSTQSQSIISENTVVSTTKTDAQVLSNFYGKKDAKQNIVLDDQGEMVSTERPQFAALSLLDQNALTSLLVHEANSLEMVPAYERTKTLKRLQRKWHFGLFLGIHRGLDFTNTRENGYSGVLGGFIERRFSSGLGLQLQANLKRTPNLNSSFSFENYYETPTSLFKVEGTYSFTSSDVFELPLMLTKSILGGKVKFMGGIKYARILNTAVVPALSANSERALYSGFLDDNRLDSDYVLQGNSVFELATVENSSLSLNENPVDKRINAIRKNDFGLVAAVGYQFNTKLSLDLRYDQGVIDIAPNRIFNKEMFDSSNSLHVLLKYQF